DYILEDSSTSSSSSSSTNSNKNSKLSSDNSDTSTTTTDNYKNINQTVNNKENFTSESDSDSISNSTSNYSDYSIPIHKKLKQKIQIFDKIDNVLNEIDKREPVIVFKKPSEFELACRFIKSNESSEAFQLVHELFEEWLDIFLIINYIYKYL
ncbi:hypothetical protein PIROE2DRAFT_13057, partial [Piromyces sp. E2]